MRRTLVFLSLIVFSAPALAGTIIMRSGTGRDCYQQTLLEPTPQHNQQGLAVCSQAIADAASDTSDYDHAAAFVNRADIRLRMEDYAGAVADSEAAIAIYPELPAAHLNRGAAMVGLKRYDEALPVLDKAIAMNTSKPELAYFNRAIAKEYLGDIRGAYYDYRKAVEINPKFQRATEELTRFKVTGTPG